MTASLPGKVLASYAVGWVARLRALTRRPYLISVVDTRSMSAVNAGRYA